MLVKHDSYCGYFDQRIHALDQALHALFKQPYNADNPLLVCTKSCMPTLALAKLGPAKMRVQACR